MPQVPEDGDPNSPRMGKHLILERLRMKYTEIVKQMLGNNLGLNLGIIHAFDIYSVMFKNLAYLCDRLAL